MPTTCPSTRIDPRPRHQTPGKQKPPKHPCCLADIDPRVRRLSSRGEEVVAPALVDAASSPPPRARRRGQRCRPP
eukprot:1520889-Alexandrium_andersonii.AAC.1